MKLLKTNLCLYCFQPITPNYTWHSVFLAQLDRKLCNTCEKQLEKIAEPTCRICSRPKNPTNEQYFKDDLCLDCIRWEDSPKWQGVLTKNTSIYLYNDFMAELIAKFKYRGDYALAKTFAQDIQQAIKNLQFDLIVPIPLSDDRLYERGFNQAEALILEADADVTPTHLLQRTHTEKQSKKSRDERIHLEQVFKLSQNQPVNQSQNKHILLIDDIYTTGSTLRHAAYVLKQAGAQAVQSLTIARG